jgi:hypothetical protein
MRLRCYGALTLVCVAALSFVGTSVRAALLDEKRNQIVEAPRGPSLAIPLVIGTRTMQLSIAVPMNPYLPASMWDNGQHKAAAKKTKPPQKISWPTIDPSMVGYIEDAGIQSEVRLRFDAGIHDDTPDRAEFFYAKCGCYRGAPAPFTDPNSPGPGPGIPRYINFQQLYFLGEYAPMSRVSLFTQIPIRWLQAHPQPGATQPFPSHGGLSDWQLGIKAAAIVTEHSILTFQLRATLPSGDAGSGLGTNHASIEPAVLYYQQISNRFVVEGEFGDTHPIGASAGVQNNSPHGFAGDVIFYGVGPSYLLVRHENFRLAPVLELVGWNVRGGYVTGEPNANTDGVNIVNLKLGPRMYFGAHSSFYAGYGVALTSQNWYREIFRTEYRYAF